MEKTLDVEHRLTAVEDRSKSNTHRLDEVEKRQDSLDKLVTSVEVLATREAAVEEKVNEISADVKEINAKPAKRWDAMVENIIKLVVAAFVGYVLAHIGL